jgi:hypothetical protein
LRASLDARKAKENGADERASVAECRHIDGDFPVLIEEIESSLNPPYRDESSLRGLRCSDADIIAFDSDYDVLPT